MSKDSQPDPQKARAEKAKGGLSVTDEKGKNRGRNHKKQSASRHKPGSDK